MLLIILQIGTSLSYSSSLGLVTLISMGDNQDCCTMIKVCMSAHARFHWLTPVMAANARGIYLSSYLDVPRITAMTFESSVVEMSRSQVETHRVPAGLAVVVQQQLTAQVRDFTVIGLE